MRRLFEMRVLLALSFCCMFALPVAVAQNNVIWQPQTSLIDTTDYTGLTPYYWFANFANPNAVTGAPMNDHEARNLPSWIHLETRPACIGMADDCVTPDGTTFTGFSFEESPPNAATSIGGQSNFNTLTLPDSSSGLSGLAVDSTSTTGNTSSMTTIRILAGAPEILRLWVVADNGAGANFHVQNRMRVNLRDTNGPPFDMDSDQQEGEALPNGQRLGNAMNPMFTQNGIADAWAFRLSGVNEHDIITIRPTSAGGIPGSLPGFAGIMIEVIPEPASALLILLGTFGWACVVFRRRVS